MPKQLLSPNYYEGGRDLFSLKWEQFLNLLDIALLLKLVASLLFILHEIHFSRTGGGNCQAG